METVLGYNTVSMPTAAAGGPVQHRFDPYSNNGGTIMAIAGDDYCIVAADTRQSVGYGINTRYAPKAFALNKNAVLASSGFYGDITNLNKRLHINLEMYKHQHAKDMSCPAIAQMLSTTLYYKRFFPYYTFNILGGLDEQGRGAVYHFDVVGSFQREEYRADGTGQELIQPLLDSQVGRKNQLNPAQGRLPLDAAIKLIRDAFTAATERDIYTGDYLEVHVITKDGVQTHVFDLKKD